MRGTELWCGSGLRVARSKSRRNRAGGDLLVEPIPSSRAAVFSGADGFETVGGGPAVLVRSDESRVQSVGPGRGAVSPASIFLHRLKGGVGGFESLRQSVGGLRKHRGGQRRVATSRSSRRSVSRVRKCVIPLGTNSAFGASGFSRRCPEAEPLAVETLS